MAGCGGSLKEFTLALAVFTLVAGTTTPSLWRHVLSSSRFLPQSLSNASSPVKAQIAFDKNMIFPGYVVDAATPTNIFVIDANGEKPELQLSKDDRSSHPVWSPDGRRIAYVHERDDSSRKWEETYEISVMQADGKDPKHLAFIPGAPKTIAWSPKGETLAFDGFVPGPWEGNISFLESSIYLLQVDGDKTPKLLVKDGSSPSWSPDGSQVAYTCVSKANPGKRKNSFCLIATDGHSKPHVFRENAWNPIWSPDGQKIVFLETIKKRVQLMVCNPDGSNLIRLTDGHHDVQSAAWSPDSKFIAFTEKRPMEDEVIQTGPLHSAQVPRVFLVDIDGSSRIPLGEKESLWCHDVSWSPDGKFIAGICASGIRNPSTRRQRAADSIFRISVTDFKGKPKIVARDGVGQAVFSPVMNSQ